jgi:threonine/homoserine/homoserine lactone efflux protein
MALEVWLTFFGAAIAISVSPRAGVIQSVATGLTHGLRRGYWSILGLEIGLMLQLALVAVGLGAKWLHTPRQQMVLNRVFSALFAAAVVLSLMRRGTAPV